MVKIKISYEHPEELKWVIERLKDDVMKIKVPRRQDGRYNKAYLEIRDCIATNKVV